MFTSIENELNDVKTLIRSIVDFEEEMVCRPMQQSFINGGKLLRPALMIWAAKCGKYGDYSKLIRTAATIELLHVASLVHDDVVDEGTVRRGVPSVHGKFGPQIAVYTGNSLLIRCMKLLHENVESDMISDFIISLESLFKGEILQYQNRGHEISLEEYLRIASGKTGSLFALAMRIGAAYAGFDHDVREKYSQLGMEFGIVFQIVDDYIDYTKSCKEAGKTIDSDLKQEIYSMPMILALRKDEGRLRKLLRKPRLEKDVLNEIKQEVYSLGGIDLVKEEIKSRLHFCKEKLHFLQGCGMNENDVFLNLLNRMESQLNE